MIGLGVVAGIVALALGGGFASTTSADAAPKAAEAGRLGIGAMKIAPIDATPSAGERIVAGTFAGKDALVKVAARADAPLSAPEPAPASVSSSSSSRTSSSSQSSRGSTSGSGWKSARASWYGPGFYGNGMAGGGTLQRDSMVVAHRTLAFGTRIQFQYNGKSCTAVVQDRGPHVSGREFDLGPGTAKALGFGGVGTVKYRILGR
jgi:rare lipoprotein A (peptidoglycan hydrolase)